MRQSELFFKTKKGAPRGERSINARLLIRGGFIHKLGAGVYNFLALGWRVHKKIEEIVREEMNKIGGEELYLAALHPRENWEITGRWQIEEIFKVKSRSGKDYALSWTAEEIVVPIAKFFVTSYKDLPKYVYQIQVKMRDELRPKSGLLRTREFIMKDLYSFHESQDDLDRYYEIVKDAYFRILGRCGLKKRAFLTLSSGGTFAPYSHEFQVLTEGGEDTIYICQKCNLAINKEVKNKYLRCPRCGSAKFRIKRAIEVGNIFKLGTKFSKPFDLKFRDKRGREKLVIMGCYGIGLGRLLGTVVEVHHNGKGIIWPKEIAPFLVHLISIEKKREISKVADNLYLTLQKNKIDVLYDDRKGKSPGEKFADSDLIGIPYRIVVSARTVKKGCVEIKERQRKQSKLIKIENTLDYIKL